MSKLVKVVNIYPSRPITTVNPPIRSTVKRVRKSTEEIRSCLLARARVEEIIPGLPKPILLNMSNYNTDNNPAGPVAEAPVTPEPEVAPVAEEPVVEETPWQKAYKEAIGDQNLAAMTRKQRRAAEAKARAIADAAVREATIENDIEEVPVKPVEPTEEEIAEANEAIDSKLEEVAPELLDDEGKPMETMDVESLNAEII